MEKTFWTRAKRLVSLFTVVFTLIVSAIAQGQGLNGEAAMLQAILWILFFFGVSMVFDLSSRLDEIWQAVKHDDVEILSLKDFDAAYGEIAKRIERAESEVLHAALAPELPRTGVNYQFYQTAIQKAVMNGRKYWYVAAIPAEGRSERLKRIELLSGYPTFDAVVYYYGNGDNILLPSFVIVDNKYLILNLPTSRVEGDFCFAIVHGELVDRYRKYFLALRANGQPYDKRPQGMEHGT